MTASTLPSLPPISGTYQYDVNPPSTALERKWNGRRLDKFIDPEGHMQDYAQHERPEQYNTASTRLKPSRRERSRGRQHSLRRVKNSNEVMRQRSSNRQDSASGGREGRQFTVANVGNNGRIYLR